MLRPRHLTLLRGALQFFGEEFLPHGHEVMQPYLDEDVDGEFTSTELQELQQFLRQVEVRYTALDVSDQERVQPQLFATIEEARAASDSTTQVATVLLPMSL